METNPFLSNFADTNQISYNYEKENSIYADCLTDQIKWNESKLAKDNNTKSPQQCLSCKMYPMCYGPCPNQINAGNSNCFFDTLNMSKKEYFRYMFTEYLLNKK